MEIPPTGLNREEIFQTLEAFRVHDLDWRSGRAFGYIFDAGREVEQVGKEAYMRFLSENGLDFTVFPSLLKLENELVDMARRHLHGDEQVVGNFTSGGTESIMLAVKTARDYWRGRRPELREPEMILPVTGHAAFHKAAHYLGVKVVPTPVDPVTFRADVAAMEQAITPNTILLVGSAPSYAHGVIDPIREIGELAQRHELLFHVDACMGGFLLPFFKELGAPVPDFDFQVPGVTSISVDLHKYAYVPKGASIVLYRGRELRKRQIFTCARWTGYTVVNTAVQSSKSGGPLAAAWAIINYVGRQGYLELARKQLEATRKTIAGIRNIPELKVLGEPEFCLVAFTSEELNIFQLIDRINAKGWYVQPALAFGGSPAHAHLSIGVSNVDHMDEFISDLEQTVAEVKKIGPDAASQGLQQMLAKLDFSNFTGETFQTLLAAAGIQGDELPKEMAPINEVMNSLPPELRELLLLEYVNNLFNPHGG